MANYRNLTQAELTIAQKVYGQSIGFLRVFIADTFLPLNDKVAVTIMYEDRRMVIGIPIFNGYWFAIYWGPDVYKKGADVTFPETLIHELVHVWQGQHGIPFAYMVKSMTAQGKAYC